ncbi:hypothetical protein ACWCWD_26735 [Streptomyces sp. NPDC001493]
MSKHARPAPEEPGDPSTPAAPAEPAASPASTSQAATSSGHGRAYQAGGNQTIKEESHHQHHHHYYAPHRPPKARLVWPLVGVVILALGGFAALKLWDEYAGSDAAPHTTASATGAGLAPNPMDNCRAWTDTGVTHVQVKPCYRVGDDGHLYIGAEWRTTTGNERVDVYVWLEDATGDELVYPAASTGALGYHNMSVWKVPTDDEQWREARVGKELKHGEKYEVCVSVVEPGDTHPSTTVPGLRGFQEGVVFP